jgi:hypothetical protein
MKRRSVATRSLRIIRQRQGRALSWSFDGYEGAPRRYAQTLKGIDQ